MQRLYQRKDSPSWWVNVKGHDGKRQQLSTGCRDRKAAEIVARELERRAADPAHAAAVAHTLDDAIHDLISEREGRGRASATIDFYLEHGGHLLRLLGRDTPLAQIDAVVVDKFITDRRAENVTQNTVSKALCTLRAALKVAKRRGRFPGDIEAIMPIAFAPEYRPRKRALRSLEELWALVRELPARRGAHVAFLVATAARDSEAFRAERADVDLERGVVFVRGTKTDTSEDTIAIPPWGRPLLEHVLATVATEKGHRGPLLAPWTSIRGDLRAACRRLGLKAKARELGTTPGRVARMITKGEVTEDEIRALWPPVTPNDLRRTHGMWLRAAGIEPSLIGRQLRHTDGRMAERVYGRLAPDDLAALLTKRIGVTPVLRDRPLSAKNTAKRGKKA